MTGKLSIADKKQLEHYIQAGPKQFGLLYSFTRDGADVSIFHELCDEKGPTVTVIYDTQCTVYGGFTEKSWTSNCESFFKDDQAFLFRLYQKGKSNSMKFPVKNPDNAIYCSYNNGPIFGGRYEEKSVPRIRGRLVVHRIAGGYDVNTFSGTILVENNQFTLNGEFNFGSAYDMGSCSIEQFCNNIKTVTDLEVYSVSDTSLLPPWRELGGWNHQNLEDLKNEIDAWSPPHGTGLKTANILFLGPVGAGKSSFFNTISSIFRGHVTGQAVCGSAEQSITSTYRMYRVRGSALTKTMKFRLCDTRGIEENQGMDGAELNYLFEGNVPNGYQFNPSTPITPDTTGFVASPTLNHKMHCVCFIIDGSTASVMSEKMLEKIKALQSKVRQKGLPQVVLVTKIDKVCSNVEEDVSKVFQSVAVQELVDTVSNIFGVPRSHVLPVKNYEKEINVRDDVSLLALHSLQQILRASEDFMFNLLDMLDDEKDESLD
ncbi:interferon-induced protein 44-like isoform X2 [Ruditapes philippinarum]|nr:interferon-induced protein 44-like isoform X2 [Ruditapes philippinarum]XP_060577911.1 interferon-induced protein 44-like isoform X2 [Ruditapes philippinarum]XP_060577912.1 interferon-induced protein 44-like isoform X2 [Ruditapes philippinarum]XP_060577913.1 interferon-induced protein 44-like isoform X2 [Ruditapes philippinarum]